MSGLTDQHLPSALLIALARIGLKVARQAAHAKIKSAAKGLTSDFSKLCDCLKPIRLQSPSRMNLCCCMHTANSQTMAIILLKV